MSSLQKRTSERPFSDEDPAVLVVGGELAFGIARTVEESATVQFVTDDEALAERGTAAGCRTKTADLTDASALAASAGDVDTAVVACGSDRRNLLVSQLLGSCCGVDRVVVGVTDGTDRDVFAGTDVDLVGLDAVFADVAAEVLPQFQEGG